MQYTVIQEAVPELPLAGHPPQVPSNPALAQTVADRLARDECSVISDFAAGEHFPGDRSAVTRSVRCTPQARSRPGPRCWVVLA